MHEATDFSAKAWADKLIAMAEGRYVEAEAKKTDDSSVAHPMVGHAMELGNFNAKMWVTTILAKAKYTAEA